MLKYLINFTYTEEENHARGSLMLFSLFSLICGVYQEKGTHIDLGIGIGPLGLSIVLHRWE